MERILISGYYGFNNAGDEAILAALIAGLKDKFKGVEITVLSAKPKFTQNLHQVDAVNRLDLKRITMELKKADLLLSGGGSLLQDVTGIKTIPYYLGVILLAKLMKTPVFFCAQGVGPVTNIVNQKLIATILNRVDLLTVRDINSKRLLKSCGVKKEIKVTADPVLNLKSPPAEVIAEILLKEEVNLAKDTIAVSVRPWGDNSYLDELAKVLENLIVKFGIQVLLIPLKYPTDLEVSKVLEENLDNSNSVQLIEGDYAPQELIGIIANCDLMLGVRLHSLIFAATAEVPLAGISYDQKVDSFLEQLGLEAIAKVDSFKQQIVYQKLLSSWETRGEQFNNWIEDLKELKSLAEDNFDLIPEKLGG